MEEKKLSEIPLDKCIYMSIGTHANESINEIIDRKEKEVIEHGLSLWAYSSPIAKKIFSFCESEEFIYVVMTVTGKPTKGEVFKAKYYKENNKNEKKEIPHNMKVMYSGKSKAKALVVEKYFKIKDEDNTLIKSDYERKHYFNGVELLVKKQDNSKRRTYKIAYVAKLKSPFSVDIE